MKHLFFTILFLSISECIFSQSAEKVVKFNETYRPQFHFSPEENRMGSPVSIVKIDSAYHLFYQWNPDNLQQGFVNWGHATSNNLMKWKHEGISISQPDGETDSMKLTPWWGSVAQNGDKNFAWANSWGEGIFRYSDFKENKWINREKTTGTEDFLSSDPFVFWHEKSNKWVMVCYNRADSTIHFLNSVNGLDWNQTSTFNYKHGFASMVELPVDRKPDDTRWLFITESGNYMLGKFDGEQFELTSPLRKFDYGEKVGGSVCFTEKQKNRTILISELRSEQNPDLPSNGQLSFPTELTLHEYINGIELQRRPIEEIKTLYVKSQEFVGRKIYPGINNNLLAGVKGETILIKGVIDLKNCDQFGFILRSDKNMSGTEINYSVANGQLSMQGNRFKYKPDNNKMEFEILIDRSSIELFIDGGRYVMSSTFIPEPKSQKFVLYTIGGEIMVDKMEVHQLKSVWR